jgi:hypothetical protein
LSNGSSQEKHENSKINEWIEHSSFHHRGNFVVKQKSEISTVKLKRFSAFVRFMRENKNSGAARRGPLFPSTRISANIQTLLKVEFSLTQISGEDDHRIFCYMNAAIQNKWPINWGK